MKLDAEIIVVGGGPAGSTTAALLAEGGRDVLVLDRARFPRDKACAEYLSPGATDALAALGVLGKIAPSGRALSGMRIRSPRRTLAVSYSDRPPGHRALGISRVILDQVLLGHAHARGARIEQSERVTSVAVESEGLMTVRSRIGRKDRTRRARLIVGADGLRSCVASSMGVQRRMRWPRRLGLVARYGGVEGLGEWGEMHVGAGGYCGIAPTARGVATVGLVVDLDCPRAGAKTGDFFERKVAELPGLARLLSGARRVSPVRGCGPVGGRVRRSAGRGFLLVGDAAGFLDPFTGEGIHRALRGAELAAAYAQVALGRADGVPAGYEEARRSAFRDKERVCLTVQGFLADRRSFDYVLNRLNDRAEVGSLLGRVLGDYHPASAALNLPYLWALLRP